MRRRILSILGGIIFILAAPAFGQIVSQGPAATTSDARAWPFKAVFGDVQIDPRQAAWFTSTANSTSTPLGIGATFTGTYESMVGFAGAIVAANPDVRGTLYLDWSTDGVNLDLEDSFPVFGGAPQSFQSAVKAKFFRAKFTNDNGAFAQTTFRLQSNYLSHQTPDLFNGLLAPVGASGSLAPWTTRALVTGGQNLNGTGVSSQKYQSFAWSDLGMTDGGYNVQLVRANAGEGDGALIRLFGEGGGNPTGYFAGGGVVRDSGAVALADTRGGAVRITPYRAFHVNFRDALGNEIAPLTDTQLRATPIPVTVGTIATTSVGVTANGRWTPSGVNDTRTIIIGTGNLAGVVSILLLNSGAFIGTIQIVGNVGGTDVLMQAMNLTDGTGPTATLAFGKLYSAPAGGIDSISIRASAYTSGFLDYEIGAGPGAINLPMGTQAVSAVALPLPNGAATSANQVTEAASLALIASTQTDRSQKMQLTDGVRDGVIKASATAAATTDPSAVVALSPNSPSYGKWATTVPIVPTTWSASGSNPTGLGNHINPDVEGYSTLTVLLKQPNNLFNGAITPGGVALASLPITFEGSNNFGSDFVALSGRTIGTNNLAAPGFGVLNEANYESGSTANVIGGYSRIWRFDVSGLTDVRITQAAYFAVGSANVVLETQLSGSANDDGAVVMAGAKGVTRQAAVTSTDLGNDRQALDVRISSPAIVPTTGSFVAPQAVLATMPIRLLPQPPCNPVRRINCSPKGF